MKDKLEKDPGPGPATKHKDEQVAHVDLSGGDNETVVVPRRRTLPQPARRLYRSDTRPQVSRADELEEQALTDELREIEIRKKLRALAKKRTEVRL